MAEEDVLPWPQLDDVFQAAKAFVEPADAPCLPIWSSTSKRWENK
jgi:hypothetical protein